MNINDFAPSATLAGYVIRGYEYVLAKGPYGALKWREHLMTDPAEAEMTEMATSQIKEALSELFNSMGMALARIPASQMQQQLLLTYEGKFVDSVARALRYKVCLKPWGEDDEVFFGKLHAELFELLKTNTARDMTGPSWRISITPSDDLVLEPVTGAT